jgi:demethylmenaquinone methyltransferase/2-methoxy-6-polyprenyl-1,4-benzoquinol methylase
VEKQRTSSTEKARSFGLSEQWFHIEKILSEVIPVYDKVNRYISLGTDLKLREEGLDALIRALPKVPWRIIDLGCGTGKMTKILRQKTTFDSILTDALPPMLFIAKKNNPDSVGLLATYENLPFRNEVFDAAIAGFAIRDARLLSRALEEIHSSLKGGGYFLIVDLCKPDSAIIRGLISVYWRLIAPALAFIASGRTGLKFAALYTTYRMLPKNSELEKLISSCGFTISKKEYKMLGGAGILLFKRN